MSDIVITDLIHALWDDARRETDPERKAQLERDASAMDDVWRRSRYALAPTREQFQAALGNTTLNIADTLAALASGQRQVDDRVGEIHEYVQQNNMLFSQFFDMFPPQFDAFQSESRTAWEESRRRLGKLEDGQDALAGHVSDMSERMDEIDTRDQQQFAESQEHRHALNDRFAELTARVDTYMSGSLREEYGRRIAALEAALEAVLQQGGGE